MARPGKNETDGVGVVLRHAYIGNISNLHYVTEAGYSKPIHGY